MSTADFGGAFGANEWLVEEMYEKYIADPASVDPQWIEFFAANAHLINGNGSAGVTTTSSNGSSNGASNGAAQVTPLNIQQLAANVPLPSSGGAPPAPKIFHPRVVRTMQEFHHKAIRCHQGVLRLLKLS